MFIDVYNILKTFIQNDRLKLTNHGTFCTSFKLPQNWNSANGFIFYGKSGEISTNKIDDQEISILSLHLLQNCLVYINTLMIQQVLSQKKLYDLMTPEDFRGLSPLIYSHVNPYGFFNLERVRKNTN